MPCSGGPTSEQTLHEERMRKRHEREVRLRTQIACAALSWIEANGHMMDLEQCIDPNENGFEVKDLRGWWGNHKREDELRRKKEAKEAAAKEEKRLQDERRKKVLDELTDEQLEALGLKRVKDPFRNARGGGKGKKLKTMPDGDDDT